MNSSKRRELQAILWARRHFFLSLALAFIAGVFVSGLWGAYERYEMSKLQQLYRLSQQQNTALVAKRAELTLTSERLRANTQALTASIREQEQENRELQRALDFYRQLMDPSQVKKGLVLHSFSHNRIEANTYRLKFTFVQYALKPSSMRAKLHFVVQGSQQGTAVELPLQQLLQATEDGGKKSATEINFRYFQELEYIIQVEPDLAINSISIDAQISRPKKASWSQEVNWAKSTAEN
ncbi:MAG: hypothetical protein HRU21_08630 [Pseudomonadales bacterium]|nr:hypothetical protein [Pseudomonadales bacterium]